MERADATETAADLAAGDLSPSTLLARCRARLNADGDRFGAFLAVAGDEAERQALEAGRRLAGGAAGPLIGLPVGVKDVFATSWLPTTGHSRVPVARALPHVDIRRTATAVQRLLDAGTITMGKTSTYEYACGLNDVSGDLPVPRNPWDHRRDPGGSSNGSAIALARGYVAVALGTDTGGSIRMPAALCGVTGLKPSFGLVPRTGSLPLAESMDHVGPMALSARDCREVLRVIAGADGADPDCEVGVDAADRVTTDRLSSLSGEPVGVVDPDQLGGVTPAVADGYRAFLHVLEDLGARLETVRLPWWEELSAAQRVCVGVESARHYRDNLAEDWGHYGVGARVALARCLPFTSADHADAVRLRDRGRARVDALFEQLRVVVMPTASHVAQPISTLTPSQRNGVGVRVFVGYWNTVGHPVLCLPAAASDDAAPVGVQVAGPRLADGEVLSVGELVQQVSSVHLRDPRTTRVTWPDGPPPSPQPTPPSPSAGLRGALAGLSGDRADESETALIAAACADDARGALGIRAALRRPG